MFRRFSAAACVSTTAAARMGMSTTTGGSSSSTGGGLSQETLELMKQRVKEFSGSEMGTLYRYDPDGDERGFLEKHKIDLNLPRGGKESPIQALERDSLRDGIAHHGAASVPLYDFPKLVDRAVGREELVFQIWQEMLQGKRLHILYGFEGIGKSVLANEFAAAGARAKKFSCIKWLNASAPGKLVSRLQELRGEMSGRKESEVLLIFDEVKDFQKVQRLLPNSDKFHVIFCMNVGSADEIAAPELIKSKEATIHLFNVPPLDSEATGHFLEGRLSPSAAALVTSKEVSHLGEALGGVPLLLSLACGFLNTLATDEVIRVFRREQEELLPTFGSLMKKISKTSIELGGTSIRALAWDILSESIRVLKRVYPSSYSVDDVLAGLALYDPAGMPPGRIGFGNLLTTENDDRGGNPDQLWTLLDSLGFSAYRTSAAAFSATSPGLADPLSSSSSSDPYSPTMMVHPLIQSLLLDKYIKLPLQRIAERVAEALLKSWPRRMRGDGRQDAMKICHQVAVMNKKLSGRRIHQGPQLAALTLKVVNFLSHSLQTLPDVAEEMSEVVYKSIIDSDGRKDNRISISLEERGGLCKDLASRLLSGKGDVDESKKRKKIKELLQDAHRSFSVARGGGSVEAASCLSLLGPFLEATEQTRAALQGAINTMQLEIRDRSGEGGEVLLYLNRTLFSLLVRKAQVTEELDGEVPSSLVNTVEQVREQIERLKV